MIVSRYFVWFILYSIAGWIYETIVMSIKHHTWENRGFLFGPMCPIYGIGAAGISAVAEIMEYFGFTYYAWWQIFLIAFFGSMVLEYSTAWGLEKIFHAYWWDYSSAPFNIQGKICLPASLGFGVAGTLIVFYLYPFMYRLTAEVPIEMMATFSLVMMCVVSVDLTLTVVSLRNFDRAVNAYAELINYHMENWIRNMGTRLQSVESKIAEERERFSLESLEHISLTTNDILRATVRRVAGFRNHYDGKRKEQFERVLQSVKNRVRIKKD